MPENAKTTPRTLGSIFFCFCFFLHSERFVPTPANMGPSTRERRPVHRLTYECNDQQDNQQAIALHQDYPRHKHESTSSAPIAIPEYVEHVGRLRRVGRPSNLSNRTLFLLEKWAPANINAEQDDVEKMHSMYGLPENLTMIRKWFTNYKYRRTPSYKAHKPLYAMRRKLRRETAKAMPTLPVSDSALTAKNFPSSMPPAPPAQTSTQNVDGDNNIDTPDDDDGLTFLTNHLFAGGFTEIDEFLSSFNMT